MQMWQCHIGCGIVTILHRMHSAVVGATEVAAKAAVVIAMVAMMATVMATVMMATVAAETAPGSEESWVSSTTSKQHGSTI